MNQTGVRSTGSRRQARRNRSFAGGVVTTSAYERRGHDLPPWERRPRFESPLRDGLPTSVDLFARLCARASEALGYDGLDEPSVRAELDRTLATIP
jgi:hypothetical protein